MIGIVRLSTMCDQLSEKAIAFVGIRSIASWAQVDPQCGTVWLHGGAEKHLTLPMAAMFASWPPCLYEKILPNYRTSWSHCGDSRLCGAILHHCHDSGLCVLTLPEIADGSGASLFFLAVYGQRSLPENLLASDVVTVVIFSLACLLQWKAKRSPIQVILLSGLLGVLLYVFFWTKAAGESKE